MTNGARCGRVCRTLDSEHRYELKFAVTAEVKNRLLDLSKAGLEHDAHGRAGVYRVSSQYFDTPDFKAYWEKLDGVGFRRKFRLRYYGNDPQPQTAFFEIKHRWDQTVFKERVPLRAGCLPELLGKPEMLAQLPACVESLNPAEERTLEQIVTAAAKTNLLGANIISYLREAWVGKYDARLRVTFDHLCRVYPPGESEAPMCSDGVPILEPAKMILEVKFNDRLPVWLRDCLSQVAVQPIRFSKYAEGLSARSDLELRRLSSRSSFPWPAHELE
jgi:SPX domain protein involved in polyphosphate accumulation